MRRARFGFLGAFGFVGLAAAGFEVLAARVDFAFGFAGVLGLRLGSGLSS